MTIFSIYRGHCVSEISRGADFYELTIDNPLHTRSRRATISGEKANVPLETLIDLLRPTQPPVEPRWLPGGAELYTWYVIILVNFLISNISLLVKLITYFRFLAVAIFGIIYICISRICLTSCEDGCNLCWNSLPNLGLGTDNARAERREAQREECEERRRQDTQHKAEKKAEKMRLQRAKNDLRIQRLHAKAQTTALLTSVATTSEVIQSSRTESSAKSFFAKGKRSTAKNEVALSELTIHLQFF